MIKLKHYYIAKDFEDLSSIAIILEQLNYDERDPAIDQYSHKQQKLFIDTRRRQFWFIDDECVDQTKKIIEKLEGQPYRLNTKYITLKEIEQWLD